MVTVGTYFLSFTADDKLMFKALIEPILITIHSCFRFVLSPVSQVCPKESPSLISNVHNHDKYLLTTYTLLNKQLFTRFFTRRKQNTH